MIGILSVLVGIVLYFIICIIIAFIRALCSKRNVSRQNLNEIENGKTRASMEMKHTLLRYLDY